MPKVSISFKGLTCIYAVLSPKQRIYIGQTWDLYHRYKSGVSKSQRMLYRSYQKYGEEAHKLFTIIEFKGAFTQSDLDYWERYYIEVYRTNGYELLNIREGGGNKGRLSEETNTLVGIKSRLWKKENPERTRAIALHAAKSNIGKKRNNETKRLQSEAAKGKKWTESHKLNISKAKKGQPSPFKGKTFTSEVLSQMKKNRAGCKPINQLAANGDIIKQWSSIQEAALTTGIHKGTIASCIRGVKGYLTAGGFKWEYTNTMDKLAYENRIRKPNSNGVPILQLTINDEPVNEWLSMSEAAAKTGLFRQDILKCLKGRRKSAGGFIWKYK